VVSEIRRQAPRSLEVLVVDDASDTLGAIITFTITLP
jgi:hypothetical protein